VATDDRQILVTGTAPAPANWLVPGNGQIRPKTITATFDGSGAGSAFIPTLKIKSDGGKLIGTYPVASSVAAGGSAEVSWFPGLTNSLSAARIAVVGARIEMHGTQSISASTNTDLTYDTVAFDTGGFANLGADNRKLTAPTNGLYLVICERAWPYNNFGRRLVGVTQNSFYASGGALLSNDSRSAIWSSPVGGTGGAPETTNGMVTLVAASAGDFFATGANTDAALSTGGGTAEYFSAILLGQL